MHTEVRRSDAVWSQSGSCLCMAISMAIQAPRVDSWHIGTWDVMSSLACVFFSSANVCAQARASSRVACSAWLGSMLLLRQPTSDWRTPRFMLQRVETRTLRLRRF
jgi:hypothetical protein